MKTGIYKICLSDTHFYIGRAKNLKNRWRDHLEDLKRGKHKNCHMQRVYNIHQVFEPQVLLYCDEDNLHFYEQKIIDALYGTEGCCNISPSADGRSGPHSEETRRKISEGNKGKQKKLGLKIHPHSEEHKRKLSEATKGRIHSEEAKRKMSEARKNFHRKKKEQAQ